MTASLAARSALRLIGLLWLTLLGPVALCATPAEEHNKRIAIDFYNAALNEKDWDKAKRYIGSQYMQHSIYMEDGIAGFESLVKRLKT